MNYSLICDLYPRLEYLFGCYMRRYPETDGRQTLEAAINRFVLVKPQLVEETIRQLRSLIHYCKAQPRPGSTAREFLSILECPYQPTDALAWLVSVCDTLDRPADKRNQQDQSPQDAQSEIQPGVERLQAPRLPLSLPEVLLLPFDPMDHFEPAARTPDVSFEIQASLIEYEVRFETIQSLQGPSLPLREVSSFLGAK